MAYEVAAHCLPDRGKVKPNGKTFFHAINSKTAEQSMIFLYKNCLRI